MTSMYSQQNFPIFSVNVAVDKSNPTEHSNRQTNGKVVYWLTSNSFQIYTISLLAVLSRRNIRCLKASQAEKDNENQLVKIFKQ